MEAALLEAMRSLSSLECPSSWSGGFPVERAAKGTGGKDHRVLGIAGTWAFGASHVGSAPRAHYSAARAEGLTMLKLWRKLVKFFYRENSVISRKTQTELQHAMLIGVRTSEEDMLSKLAELDKVLRRER